MQPASSTPPEAEALEQLERAEAAVRRAPTPRVLWRARAVLELLTNAEQREQAARDLGKALDAMRRSIAASGLPLPTDDEIDAEVRAVRAERMAAEQSARR